MALSLLLRSIIILALSLCHVVSAKYTLLHHYSPKNFFDGFDFFTGPDPTNGFVQYVDRSYAHEHGLISSHKDFVGIGVDHQNIYSITDVGRPSVRLQSRATYTQGLFILSLNHMPFGCGTWPAFWTLGPFWPSNGEIDIIEGVNLNSFNIATLHTGPDCTVAGLDESGTLLSNNCTSSPSANIGCGVQNTSPQSYGDGFNKGGGGVYAMEWSDSHIQVWFFPHHAVPGSINRGKPEPRNFGRPMAKFKGSCNIDSSFAAHQLIFDITFCGDYAGSTYDLAACPGAGGGLPACVAYVAGNPREFTDAHWSINYLKVYQKTGGPAAAAAADGKIVGDHKTMSSKQPVAATSKLLSSSLRHAGMGVPATVTHVDKREQVHARTVENVAAQATPVV